MTTQELIDLLDKCVLVGKFLRDIEDNYCTCQIRIKYSENNSNLVIRYSNRQFVRPIAELLGGTVDDLYSPRGLVHNGIRWKTIYT